MAAEAKSQVYFWALPDQNGAEPLDLTPGLVRLTAALELAPVAAAPRPWAIKIHLGAPHRPAAVNPAWVQAIVGQLGASPGQSFLFDTLSITTPGLDSVAGHLNLAGAKGYGADSAQLPFIVADDPDLGAPLISDSPLPGHTVAAGLRQAHNLCVLTPVRPHPHLGLRGALATLGLEMSDRDGKIALHRDIRPQVDTPLCAGCGSCLTVCLFDAIELRAGRAFIDHNRCTGCGECLNVCFMAGISAAEAEGIPRFQTRVAEAALAVREAVVGPELQGQVYFNFLVRLDRQDGGVRARKRNRLGNLGVLAGHDPVALDQATMDLITERMDGQLNAWSGFNQVPDVLLARADALGLGKRVYNLVTV